MSPLRSLPHLPIQFAILKSRYPAWSLGSRGAESRSESTWWVRLAPHPHPIMRRFLYGTTRPGSTTTPRLGDLRPGICSWTRSHLVWRVRPPPSRFGGSRSAGSPKHGLWSRGPISNTSLDVLPCPQHSGYPRVASLASGTSYMRCYRAPAARSAARALPSRTRQHCSLDRDVLVPSGIPSRHLSDVLRTLALYPRDFDESPHRDVRLQRHQPTPPRRPLARSGLYDGLREAVALRGVFDAYPGMSNACSIAGSWGRVRLWVIRRATSVFEDIAGFGPDRRPLSRQYGDPG